MNGIFITLEGVEGSGKSTQIKLLADYLTSKGREVVLTREPGGTPIAEAIRNLLMERCDEKMAPLTELFLYEAARVQHAQELIIPALLRGAVVLCDRYADSTMAYQGAGRRLADDFISLLNRLAAGVAWPDMTFLLDLPAETGLRRARERGSNDRMMEEDLAFHERIRNEFLALAQGDPERITIVDGTRPVEAIQEEMRSHVDQMPGIGRSGWLCSRGIGRTRK